MQHSTSQAQAPQMLGSKSWAVLRMQSSIPDRALLTGAGGSAHNTGTATTAPQLTLHLPRAHCRSEALCIWNNPHCTLQTRSHWPIYTVIKLLVLNKSNYTTAYLLQLTHSNPACSRLLKFCLNIYWANRTETFYSYRHLATVSNPTTLSCTEKMIKIQEIQ